MVPLMAENPSFQCTEKYYAGFINYKGQVEPELKTASGHSKFNLMIELKVENNDTYVENLNVNGTKFIVSRVNGDYIYAHEFTRNNTHNWVFFKNPKDNKYYVSLQKAYDLLGTPLVNMSLYSCEKVNNNFFEEK